MEQHKTVVTKISYQELSLEQQIEKVIVADKKTEEATKIKYTINKCLEIFRDIFSAEACYLYLNTEMDEFEKKEIFNERMKEMQEAYEKAGGEKLITELKKDLIPPNYFSNYPTANEYSKKDQNTNDTSQLDAPDSTIDYSTFDFYLNKDKTEFKILKFIDVSQKQKEDGTYYWNYDYRNRPKKYIILTKDKNGEKVPENKIIYNEGITAFIYRSKNISLNVKEDHEKSEASASLNSKHGLKPKSKMSIGIPLLYNKERLNEIGIPVPFVTEKKSSESIAIGVLTLEYYDENKRYGKTVINEGEQAISIKEKIEEANLYLPLLVKLILTSRFQFKRDSYDALFGGKELLTCLKDLNKDSKMKIGKIDKGTVHNQKIYKDTLHLFYVLERNEYVGYEEILGRVADYANDISKYLELSSESKPFTDFLEKFKKHEELLLYGLSDFRDHFMHQFHVFVSGYIIINLIGFDKFKEKIQKSMNKALGKSVEISDFNVLRIWFLVSFFHDHAYIFEKIQKELGNFFESTFNEEFNIYLNWDQMLKTKSKFPTYLTNLQSFFSKQEGTNPDAIIKNYLDSIINTHDHGVLSALLLLNYYSEYKNINPNHGNIKDDCLYAAFAISVHNRYENLMEDNLMQISFETFPIAFLLSFCDIAQSFGRLGKRQEYPSKFLGIDFLNNRIAYKIEYLEGKKIPTPEKIEEWAKNAHNTFKSNEYFFSVENYDSNKKPICTLSYGFYPPSQSTIQDIQDIKTFISVRSVTVELGEEYNYMYCKVNESGNPILETNTNFSKAMVIAGEAEIKEDKKGKYIKIAQDDKVFLCSLFGQGYLTSIGMEFAKQSVTVIFKTKSAN